MHEIAEYGIAAHALYKDGVGSPTEMLSRESSAYAWLRRTIELLAEGSNPEEFLEHTKLELFHDQVFCFTPKGKLIALPRRANADRLRLCGAYRRRQHGGRLQDQRQDRAARVRADQRRRGRDHHLEGADVRRRRPGNRSSSPARRAPRSAAPPASAVRSQYAGLGRRIVERLCQRAKIAYSDEKLHGRAAAPGARLDRGGDVGGRPRRDAGRRCRPRHVSRLQGGARRRDRAAAEGRERLVRAQAHQGGQVSRCRAPVNGPAIPIRGINSDLPVRFAPNGGAVPGDRIVGILTPGEGITIYPIQSPSLKDFEDQPERWLDLRWDVDDVTPQRFPARIALKTVNEPGSLAQVAQVIAEHDGNIDNIRMTRQSPDFTSITIDLEVYDLKHLTSIIAQLRAKDVVAQRRARERREGGDLVADRASGAREP